MALCKCGCQRETPIATKTRRGYVKGEHMDYVHGHNRRQKSLKERLEEKLVRNEASGCLEWTGARGISGHGQIGVGSQIDGTRRLELTHRLAWLLAGREIPADKPHVLHSCDNGCCCELSHLRVGTNADNRADMAKRNRGPKGTGQFPYGVARNHKRFMVRLSLGNQKFYLGTYDTPEEAGEVARKAKEAYYAAQV